MCVILFNKVSYFVSWKTCLKQADKTMMKTVFSTCSSKLGVFFTIHLVFAKFEDKIKGE